jgi:hypothetical protein
MAVATLLSRGTGAITDAATPEEPVHGVQPALFRSGAST